MITVYVWTAVEGETAVVKAAVSYLPVDVRQPFREAITRAFEPLFVGRVIVAFDWELEGGVDDNTAHTEG